MIVPVDRQIDKAQNIAYEIGVTAISAIQSEPCGTFNSSTIIVMIIAITPSLNAARRSLPMTLSLLVQTARHYQGQQSNLATGAEGRDTSRPPANVRFTPKSGHYNSVSKCPLCAKSRHSGRF